MRDLSWAGPAAAEFAGGCRGGGPRNAREELLCGLFAAVLDVTAVGAEDSFFELGGDSITSRALVTRAREAGLGLEYRDVFEGETVAALAVAAVDVCEGGG